MRVTLTEQNTFLTTGFPSGPFWIGKYQNAKLIWWESREENRLTFLFKQPLDNGSFDSTPDIIARCISVQQHNGWKTMIKAATSFQFKSAADFQTLFPIYHTCVCQRSDPSHFLIFYQVIVATPDKLACTGPVITPLSGKELSTRWDIEQPDGWILTDKLLVPQGGVKRCRRFSYFLTSWSIIQSTVFDNTCITVL